MRDEVTDMASQKVGDTIIAKRVDGKYDVLLISGISGARDTVRDSVIDLEIARHLARNNLTDGGTVWYRHHEDPPDHLELF